MKIIGFKKVDFETPDKKTIKGYKVFCTLEDDDKVTGVACESFFVTEERAAGWMPKVGDYVELVYNKYGKIDRVEAA